jgi:hypothetical protein
MHSFTGNGAWRASTETPHVWVVVDDSLKWGSASVRAERADDDEHGVAKRATHRHMV